jgi:Kef-type K+ transport system membrane component KefB
MSMSAPLFHQPPVIFEILSGIILGPTVFGHYKKYHSTIFPTDTIAVLELIADLGLVFYMFTVGVHLNTDKLARNMKVSSVYLRVASLFLLLFE